MPPEPAPRTPTDVRADMQRCAGSIEGHETALPQEYERRNRLLAEGEAVGMSASEMGEIFGLKAQTVRWNLKRDAAAAPQPNAIPRRRKPAGASA